MLYREIIIIYVVLIGVIWMGPDQFWQQLLSLFPRPASFKVRMVINTLTTTGSLLLNYSAVLSILDWPIKNRNKRWLVAAATLLASVYIWVSLINSVLFNKIDAAVGTDVDPAKGMSFANDSELLGLILGGRNGVFSKKDVAAT